LGQAASFVILLMLTIAVALTVGKVAWDRLVHGLVFQLLLLCVLLLIAYVALPDWGSLSRARTGLLHATNASATASLGFILLLSSRLLYGWRWTRSLLLPGLAIFATVLALAQSRTALAITVIVCAGLSALLAPPLWRAIGMASIGIGGVLYLAIDLGAGTTDFVLAELSTYLSRGQTVQQMAELSGREEMWTAMWNSFLTSPWIGHGYFVCASTGELYVWYSWGNWTAHNFWLQVLVTTGVIGCCWMVWAIAKFAFGLLRAVWREEFEWQFAAFVGAIMFWQIGWGINNESFAGPLQPECVVYLVLLGITAGRLAFSPLSAAEPVKQCSTPKF
jgi:O-antigen ligase